jgi:hypothetical protein
MYASYKFHVYIVVHFAANTWTNQQSIKTLNYAPAPED